MEIELLDNIVRRCKKALGENLVSVILFGSVARKSYDSRSDIDLLIVVEREVSDDFLREIRMDCLLNSGTKLDTVLLNRKDVTDNFEHFSPLFLSFILGITILFDTGFFREKYSEFLNRVKEEEILYVEGGKVWDLQKISSENLQ